MATGRSAEQTSIAPGKIGNQRAGPYCVIPFLLPPPKNPCPAPHPDRTCSVGLKHLPSPHPPQHLAHIPLVQETHERIPRRVLLPLVLRRLGDLLRDLLTVELGDHGERHVRAGRDARRSRERPILHPAR